MRNPMLGAAAAAVLLAASAAASIAAPPPGPFALPPFPPSVARSQSRTQYEDREVRLRAHVTLRRVGDSRPVYDRTLDEGTRQVVPLDGRRPAEDPLRAEWDHSIALIVRDLAPAH